VPDLPVEEAGELCRLATERDMKLIQLVTPTTPRDRALKILETTTGFLYYVSVAGITGERKEISPDLAENVSWMRSQTSLPVCIGFGISGPDQVRALAPMADGLIVGSALVRRLADAASQPRAEVVADFLRGEYDAQHGRLNPVYRALYGMDLPRIRNYAPGHFESLDSKVNAGLDDLGQGGGAPSRFRP
jgi:tryptophan synthase alpha chain